MSAATTEKKQQTGASVVICLFLVVATVVVYGRTVGFGFVAYDDEIYVYENPHITSGLSLSGLKWAFTSIHEANWHPLTTLSHMLDCSLYGLWAGGHHLTNVILHAASSVVLFLALRRLTGAVWQSGMVAALFCLHPLHVESVAWISERKDVLSGLFFGLTLWAYAAYVDGAVSFALVVAMFTLGLLSKPMLVTLPLVLLLLDYWPLKRWAAGMRIADLFLEKVPLFAMSAAICAVTYLVQHSRGAINEQAPLLLRAQTALLAYGGYLLKAIVPLNLSANYPLQWKPAALSCAACLLALVCLSAAAVFFARRGNGAAAVGWLWFLGMIVPVSGIVLIGDQAMADRYTYLALTGLFLAVVFTVGGFLKGRSAVAGSAVFAVVLVALAVLAFVQVGYWRDTEAIWRHALETNRDNPLAHANLASLLHRRGPEGKAEAEEHLHEALQIRPDDALANLISGDVLTEKGDWEGAARHYEVAVHSRPSFPTSHLKLGMVLRTLNRSADAEAEMREALRLDPDFPAANKMLGTMLVQSRRAAESLPFLAEAEAADPSDLEVRRMKALAHALMHQIPAAISEFRAILTLDPNDFYALESIAWYEATSPETSVRNGEEAVEFAGRAAALQRPTPVQALDTLAAAYAESGRFKEAVETAQIAQQEAEQRKDQRALDGIADRMKLYQAGKPYRDPFAQ